MLHAALDMMFQDACTWEIIAFCLLFLSLVRPLYSIIKYRKLNKTHIINALVFLCCFFSLKVCFISYIVGDSMLPNFKEHDIIFVSRISPIDRYDVILFKNDIFNKIFIKRVYGMPGETITCVNGDLYIGSERIENICPCNERTEDKCPCTEDNWGPCHIEEDCYFVLGDNRKESADSRYLMIGQIEKNKIKGKVITKLSLPLYGLFILKLKNTNETIHEISPLYIKEIFNLTVD